MWALLIAGNGTVGYWSGTDRVDSADDAALYDTLEDANAALAYLRSSERWRFIVHGMTAFPVLA